MRYAKLTNLEIFDGGFVQEMHMNFADSSVSDQRAYVRVRTIQSQPASTWEVILNGIPRVNEEGKEVTVNW